ncbi:MAG: amidophosphoribosyltransferase [Bacillota bacterium]
MSHGLEGDILKEACGVFGVWGLPEAAKLSLYGLYALQHRGQESAGIAAVSGRTISYVRGMGLLSDVFDGGVPDSLEGRAAIGHVRYSTTGSSCPENVQPLVFRYRQGQLALAHNGNLVNAHYLRAQLEEGGSIFQTTLDTEVVAHLVAQRSRESLDHSIQASFQQVKGAYAFVFLTPEVMAGIRDPNGIRPLVLGKLDSGYILASETCALDAVGAGFQREVAPGELVMVDRYGLRSFQALEPSVPSLCVFEHIYFARPDSQFNGTNVHAVRKALGRKLAEAYPVEADLVTGVPDSSVSAAAGYAEFSGLPYEMGLIKNRYIGRTFIQPSQAQRDFAVRVKLNPMRRLVDGKRVVLVDDSIVRGTTSRHIVRLLKEAGAREVHLRISSPPYRFPCFYGIDTSAPSELVAATKSLEEIRSSVEADSLFYLTNQQLFSALGSSEYCTACFDGKYPVEIPRGTGKSCLEVLPGEVPGCGR